MNTKEKRAEIRSRLPQFSSGAPQEDWQTEEENSNSSTLTLTGSQSYEILGFGTTSKNEQIFLDLMKSMTESSADNHSEKYKKVLRKMQELKEEPSKGRIKGPSSRRGGASSARGQQPQRGGQSLQGGDVTISLPTSSLKMGRTANSFFIQDALSAQEKGHEGFTVALTYNNSLIVNGKPPEEDQLDIILKLIDKMEGFYSDPGKDPEKKEKQLKELEGVVSQLEMYSSPTGKELLEKMKILKTKKLILTPNDFVADNNSIVSRIGKETEAYYIQDDVAWNSEGEKGLAISLGKNGDLRICGLLRPSQDQINKALNLVKLVSEKNNNAFCTNDPEINEAIQELAKSCGYSVYPPVEQVQQPGTAVSAPSVTFLTSEQEAYSSAPTADQLIANSKKFDESNKFPTQNNRASALIESNAITREELADMAANTRPIVHNRVATAMNAFLNHKKAYGTDAEKQVYNEMNLEGFIDRLLTKRPLMFMTSSDEYILRDGKGSGSGGFDNLQNNYKEAALCLHDYLSYDEMQFAALLGVSNDTYFINKGHRYNGYNNGRPPESNDKFTKRGFLQGLVGSRFEREEKMEYRHMIVTKTQNTQEKGYGANSSNSEMKIFSDLYGVPNFPSYEEVAGQVTQGSTEYIEIGTDINGDMRYFNIAAYKGRMKITVEESLIDANDRGRAAKKKAHLRPVGLGLGVWGIKGFVGCDKETSSQLAFQQTQLLVDLYADVLRENNLEHIGEIEFIWFGETTQCGGVMNGCNLQDAANHLIKIQFNQKNPADPIADDKLLVAQYAWDGGSFPGNEYWAHMLAASGDPAAACCSGISELQNPYVNTGLTKRTALVAPNAAIDA